MNRTLPSAKQKNAPPVWALQKWKKSQKFDGVPRNSPQSESAQGQVPTLLQLMYLGNGEIVRYAPDESDLLATERKIEALWQAIERAMVNRDWAER